MIEKKIDSTNRLIHHHYLFHQHIDAKVVVVPLYYNIVSSIQTIKFKSNKILFLPDQHVDPGHSTYDT
jgi:hypothetical protein